MRMPHAEPVPPRPMSSLTKTWRRVFALASVLLWLGIFVAALYPFAFHPRNDVNWVEGGLGFGRHGIVLSQGPFLTESSGDNSSCSIEIFLKPGSLVGFDKFLVFLNPAHSEQLTLTQFRDGIVIWRQSGQGKHRRADERGVGHFFNSWQPMLLTITSGQKGSVVYSNGRPLERFPSFSLSRLAMNGILVFGTDTAHINTWSGQLRGLALYARELSPQEVAANFQNWLLASGAHWNDDPSRFALFTFRGGLGTVIRNLSPGEPDLVIPPSYLLPSKPFLVLPWDEFRSDWDYVNDLIRNVLGFVPLGFAVCGYFSLTGNKKAVLVAVVMGALTSLCIEVLQGFIPQRESGTTDVLTNTLGTVLGAFLVQSGPLRRFLQPRQI